MPTHCERSEQARVLKWEFITMSVGLLLARELGVNDTIIAIPTCTVILIDRQIPLMISNGKLYVSGALCVVTANLCDAIPEVFIAVVLC